YRPIFGSVLLILTTLTLPVFESIYYGPLAPPIVPLPPPVILRQLRRMAQPSPPANPGRRATTRRVRRRQQTALKLNVANQTEAIVAAKTNKKRAFASNKRQYANRPAGIDASHHNGKIDQ
ncbi:MAG: hypothetical protein IPI39_16650, partial [Candidatus Obscuribacter sp.]|nr:hypothetical protein [Candidatus Obscuribacter sp.]